MARALRRLARAPRLALWILLGLSLGCAPPEPGPEPVAIEPVEVAPAEPQPPAPAATAIPAGAAALPSFECPELSVHCGQAPTVAFGPRGRLWAAFALNGHVYVSHSGDLGATFSSPVRTHEAAEVIETNGENRPKIAFGPPGTIYLSWTQKAEGRFNGNVRFTRSLDGGASFEPVRTINDDGLLTGHRFESLHVDAAGNVVLAWIDKRDRVAARARGETYRGAALYTTVSTDHGASFAANRRVADFACECCRIAVTEAPEAGVAVLWRHIFDGQIRDHAFAVLGTDGVSSPMQRATIDGWQVQACPHHGPAMVPAKNGSYHTVWFTGANNRPAAYYGRFDPVRGAMEAQTPMTTSVQAHPDIAAAGDDLFVVWKQTEHETTWIYLKTSADDGLSWDEGTAVADTVGKSDHPFLLGREGRAFLAWKTEAEGLRVISLTT